MTRGRRPPSAQRQSHVLGRVRAFVSDRSGQDVVEYGLLIAAIVVVILLSINAFGHEIQPWFEFLAGRITTVGT